MLQGLGGWHLIAIVFLVLLLFGAPKLPALAKSLGQSARILKKEVSASGDEPVAAAPAVATPVDVNEAAAQTTQNQAAAEGSSDNVR